RRRAAGPGGGAPHRHRGGHRGAAARRAGGAHLLSPGGRAAGRDRCRAPRQGRGGVRRRPDRGGDLGGATAPPGPAPRASRCGGGPVGPGAGGAREALIAARKLQMVHRSLLREMRSPAAAPADAPLSQPFAAYAAAVAVSALCGLALAPAGRRLAGIGSVAGVSPFPFARWPCHRDIRPTPVRAAGFPAVVFIGALGHGGRLRRLSALPAEGRPADADRRDRAIAPRTTPAATVFTSARTTCRPSSPPQPRRRRATRRAAQGRARDSTRATTPSSTSFRPKSKSAAESCDAAYRSPTAVPTRAATG